MNIAGKIIALTLVAVYAVLASVFLIRRHAYRQFVVYFVLLTALVASHVLEWVGFSFMAFAQEILLLLCLIASLILCLTFQSEFKSILAKPVLGKHKTENSKISDEEIRDSIQAIVTACQTLSKSRTGALIIVVQNKIDPFILDSGIRLNALVSAPLLVSIFNPKSPMHDGAVIIRDNRILTAGAFLPLTQSAVLDKDLGTRHRAGLGITESAQNDVISVVVSEETGIISVCEDKIIKRYLTPERLFDILYQPYGNDAK